MMNLQGGGITTVWFSNKRNTFIRIKENSKIDGVTVLFQNDNFKTIEKTLTYDQLLNLLGDEKTKKFLGV
jgi:hypothetical protein